PVALDRRARRARALPLRDAVAPRDRAPRARREPLRPRGDGRATARLPARAGRTAVARAPNPRRDPRRPARRGGPPPLPARRRQRRARARGLAPDHRRGGGPARARALAAPGAPRVCEPPEPHAPRGAATSHA